MTNRSKFQNQLNILLTTILLSVLLLFVGCKEEYIEINVEEYLEFLHVEDEQRIPVQNALETAQSDIESYMSTESFDTLSDKEIFDIQLALTEKLHNTVVTLDTLLNGEQRYALRQSNFYYFFNQFKQGVSDKLLDDFDISDELVVAPDPDSSMLDSLSPMHRIWTIYFGQAVYPQITGRKKRSISRSARNSFPIGVQATLSNSYSHGKGKYNVSSASMPEEELLTEINVIIQSRLHPDFINIDKWVVYIKLEDGTLVEPKKIIKRDKEWFDERGLLINSLLPSFIFPRVQDSFAQQRQKKVQKSTYAFDVMSGYYQLFFPQNFDGSPLLSPGNRMIELVFLEEVGGDELASGIWHLQWEK